MTPENKQLFSQIATAAMQSYIGNAIYMSGVAELSVKGKIADMNERIAQDSCDVAEKMIIEIEKRLNP